jgi:hypothetical protein
MLISCTQCHRHVRVAAGTCPFCGNSVTSVQAVRQVRAGSSRAMRVFASAALAVATGACTSVVALYGALPPPSKDGGTDASADGEVPQGDSGPPLALYGAPVFVDAGPDADAETVVAAYGAPPKP